MSKTSQPQDEPISMTAHRLRHAILRLKCFEQASDEMLDQLVPLTDYESYAAGDTVLSMGQFDGSLLIGLVDGKAQLTKTGATAGDLDMEVVTGGRLIGLSSALSHQQNTPLPISMVASTHIDVVMIETEGLRRLIRSHVDLAAMLVRFFAQEVVRLEAPDDDQIGPERRVFRQILSLVRREGERFYIPEMPRHAALAEAAGVSDRAAAAAIATLISDGIAQRDYPGMDIISMEALRSAAF